MCDCSDVWTDDRAMGLLLNLKGRGFHVGIAPGDRLLVTPGSRLTTMDEDAIVGHLAVLKILVRCADDGVLTRRAAFSQVLARGGRLLQVSDTARLDDVRICYSCGDPLAEARGGRCWRCQLASRLACGAPIPVDLVLAWTVEDVLRTSAA